MEEQVLERMIECFNATCRELYIFCGYSRLLMLYRLRYVTAHSSQLLYGVCPSSIWAIGVWSTDGRSLLMCDICIGPYYLNLPVWGLSFPSLPCVRSTRIHLYFVAWLWVWSLRSFLYEHKNRMVCNKEGHSLRKSPWPVIMKTQLRLRLHDRGCSSVMVPSRTKHLQLATFLFEARLRGAPSVVFGPGS